MSHPLSEVIGVQSFVRVLVIFLAIFSVHAFCENSADDVEFQELAKKNSRIRIEPLDVTNVDLWSPFALIDERAR